MEERERLLLVCLGSGSDCQLGGGLPGGHTGDGVAFIQSHTGSNMQQDAMSMKLFFFLVRLPEVDWLSPARRLDSLRRLALLSGACSSQRPTTSTRSRPSSIASRVLAVCCTRDNKEPLLSSPCIQCSMWAPVAVAWPAEHRRTGSMKLARRDEHRLNASDSVCPMNESSGSSGTASLSRLRASCAERVCPELHYGTRRFFSEVQGCVVPHNHSDVCVCACICQSVCV